MHSRGKPVRRDGARRARVVPARIPAIGRRRGMDRGQVPQRSRTTRTALQRTAGRGNESSIDAKLNGAYILLGPALRPNGDFDKTIVISTRCGQDSDCNPANAGGVLFTTVGFSQLPERFVSALDPNGKFSHTPYDFPTLVEASKKIVREAVQRSGGRVEKRRKRRRGVRDSRGRSPTEPA